MDYRSFAPGASNNNTTPPPVLLPEPPKHLPKLVTLVVLFLALGLATYAGILYWQNQQLGEDYAVQYTPRIDPTADWKTYTNTQYGFEFKYPSDWIAKTNFNGSSFNPSTVTVLSPQALKDSTVSSYQKDMVDFYVYNSINDLNNPYRLHTTNLLDFLNQNSDVASFNKSTFNDLLAYDVNLGGEGTYFAIFFEANGKIYEILFNAITNRLEISTLEKQILSTFKFTDLIDTSTWKTYTNTQYGFEITFNDLWEGYTITESTCGLVVKLNQPATENHPCFIIKLPTQDEQWNKVIRPSSNGYFEAVYFNIYTPSQWTKALKQNQIVIAQNSNYVVTYTASIDYPTSINIESLKISEILSTFKLTK